MWLVKDLIVILKGRFCCFAKEPVEDVTVWSESIEKLLESQGKKATFQTLLSVEFLSYRNSDLRYKKKKKYLKKSDTLKTNTERLSRELIFI